MTWRFAEREWERMGACVCVTRVCCLPSRAHAQPARLLLCTHMHTAILSHSSCMSHVVTTHRFRRLALKYHPDCNKDEDSKEEFARVCESYDVLSDREWCLRARFCRGGEGRGWPSPCLPVCPADDLMCVSLLSVLPPCSPLTPPIGPVSTLTAKRKGYYDLYGEHGLKDGEMDAQGGGYRHTRNAAVLSVPLSPQPLTPLPHTVT